MQVQLLIEAAPSEAAFNDGDYYVYLQHDSGLAVLLNRPGKTAANPLGYPDNGFDITFQSAAADIHTYQDTQVFFTS